MTGYPNTDPTEMTGYPSTEMTGYPDEPTTAGYPNLNICEDASTKCEKFKKYCNMNDFVTQRCLKTCGVCKSAASELCEDESTMCSIFKRYCGMNSFVDKRCQKTCGFCQRCQPKDSDACLQASPGWSTSFTCSNSIGYCTSYGKDMRRCCPESCATGVFTEQDCIAFSGSGACTYPNEAQCPAR